MDVPYTTTLSNELFLQFDNISEKRILIFASRRHLQLLCSSTKILCDGTFYFAPTHFAQLYTLHGKKFGKFFPFLYAFLPDKRNETYLTLFTQVKNLFDTNGFIIRWEQIVMDFEAAAHTAASTIFPNIELKGCNFHYGQCLWRRIQGLGLASVCFSLLIFSNMFSGCHSEL